MNRTGEAAAKTHGAAFVIGCYPPSIGGAERRAQRLAGALAGRGVPVLVLTRRAPGTPAAEKEPSGATVLRLGPIGGGPAGGLLFYLRVFNALLARRKEYGVIQNFLFSTLTLVCCAAGKALGKPVFVSLGGTGSRGGLDDVTGAGRFVRLKKRLALACKPHFITPNSDGLRELRENGVDDARMTLLPNPAQERAFFPPSPELRAQLRRELKFAGAVFLFAGRFVQDKNLPLLISSWKLFSASSPDAMLVLAGDGPEYPAIEKMTLELGVHARLCGMVSNMEDYYRAADFFVLPSDNEGMSNALLEAMLCGLPPLVKDISGCAMVEDGRNGLKASRRAAPEEFSALLSRAAALPPAEKEAMGRNAARTVADGYTLDSVASRYLELYNGAAR